VVCEVPDDILLVAELPDGLTVVSVLTAATGTPTYQVRDGDAVLAEYTTLTEIFDFLNSKE
jgi:hypothetical protein